MVVVLQEELRHKLETVRSKNYGQQYGALKRPMGTSKNATQWRDALVCPALLLRGCVQVRGAAQAVRAPAQPEGGALAGAAGRPDGLR